MNKKQLENFIDDKLVYWWERLGLHGGYFCRREFKKIAKGHPAEIDRGGRHGVYIITFDLDKLIKRTKREIEKTVCHECLHALFNERVGNLIDTHLDPNHSRSDKTISRLVNGGEERLCCLLADILISGGDYNKFYNKVLKEYKSGRR